jgi:hypothetical protein
MLFFPVYREPNCRQTASPPPAALHSTYLRRRDERLPNATPLDPSSYKCPLSQLLSFACPPPWRDILTNARGVWGPVDHSLNGRPRKSFRSNAYGPHASVANKQLTLQRSPLDATLTENRGEGLSLALGRSNVRTCNDLRSISFIVTSLAAPHLLTPVKSHPYKNHRGEGVPSEVLPVASHESPVTNLASIRSEPMPLQSPPVLSCGRNLEATTYD